VGCRFHGVAVQYAGCYNWLDGRTCAGQPRPAAKAREEVLLSSRQWSVTVVVGLAVTCLAFCAGSSLGLYLMDGLPELPVILTEAGPRAASSSSPSPTVAVQATAIPTTTAQPSPKETATRAVPYLTPGPPATATPQEPFVSDNWEPDDAPADANGIEMGGRQTHNLHVAGDRDWLYFDALGGTTYTIETSQLGAEMDTVVYLYDGEGNELASDDDGAEEFLASRLVWMAEEDGRLYVMIGGFADTEEGRGTEYDVSVGLAERFRIDEYEPDDMRRQATRIEVGETQRHNRHVAGDVDWLSFEAQAGTTYVIKTSGLGDRADTAIYLYDARGTELAFDDDSGTELWASRLRWTAPESGLFYVKVTDWLQGSSGPGTAYDVSLSAP
jgi:hypothetical protein